MGNPEEEEEDFFFFYSPDMWALPVIGMVRNLEHTKHFSGSQIHSGATSQWSCTDQQLWSYFSERELYQTHPYSKTSQK
jgi:hypothetical protein